MTIPIELENVVGAALSQTASLIHKTAKERALSSWASEMLLKKADGMLVEMMCPEMLQNQKDLADLFVCSTKLRKIGENLKNIQLCAAGSSNIEPQHQQKTATNAGGSKATKAAGHGDAALTNVTKTNSEALMPQLQASSGETSGSRKKKKKKNNTVSEDAIEALDPSAVVSGRDPLLPPLDYIPISTPIWMELRGYLARLMNRGLKDGNIQMDPTTLKVKAVCPLFVDEDSTQEVQTQPTKAKDSKGVEELKSAHQKDLTDLSKKYEAIKFENRNLKMDRNKELERLRREHASLSEESSNHATELTELRSHINTLESELSEKSEVLGVCHKDNRELKAQLSKVPDEIKAIKNYRPDLEAHIAIFDANQTSMAIEDNHAEFLSSKRHEYRFKDSSSTIPKRIANDPLLSDEGKAICATLQDLRKDNAELRARCLWYWDLFQQPGKVKSLAWNVHESVSEFIPNAMDAEDRLKEVEAGWNREKEWEKKRLLFDVGVAVRKRFFEQSKSMLSNRKAHGGPDYEIIKEGNGACHRGDPLADAALFELGLLSGPDNVTAFKDLYYCEPHAIATFPREFNEAIGNWATISTTDATPASEKHRAEALECFNSILGLWMGSLTPEDFQANLDNSRGLLLQLRELPKQIVRIDRSNKYRGYVEDKVASTSCFGV